MSLPALSMRYRPIVLTIVFLLCGWGAVSFFTMPRREDPEYTVRACLVSAVWPGAPAEKVEELVTKPLEEAIDSIDEVDYVKSTTLVGQTSITVTAEDAVTAATIDNVWDKVRARVARVKMPDETVKVDVNDDFGDTYILVLGVHQKPLPGEDKIREENRYTPRQLERISEDIQDALRLLDGVAKVDLFGVREESIYIQTDLATWSQLALSINQLQQLVAARNIIASGGTIDTKAGRFSVTPGGDLNAIEELNSIVVGMSSKDAQNRQVYLRDLGLKVQRGYQDPPTVISRFGDAHTSEPTVIVAVTMKSGANIVDICDASKARVREMQEVEQSLPPDIAITPVSDQSQNVNKKISDVVANAIGAVVIVVLVVYLMVGMRVAAVIAANIPVVVLASFAFLPPLGVQLEQISLASVIIALGLLVDNAVQVCTQCRANQIEGMSPEKAAVSGSEVLTAGMFNGTATTIAAFFPMLIGLEGTKKEYVYSLPVTLSITLGMSWLFAMSFCTILAAKFIRPPKDPSKPSAPVPWLFDKVQRLFRRGKSAETGAGENVVEQAYRRFAKVAISAKYITFGISVALLVWAVSLPIASEFFPMDDRDQFAIQIWLPENVGIEETDAATKQVEDILRALSPTDEKDENGETVQRVRAMRSMVGRGGSRWYLSWDPEPPKPNFAEILIRTTDPKYTPELARRVREIAERGDEKLGFKPLAGVRVVPRQLYLGPGAQPVEIRVFGAGFADKKTLRGISDRVKAMVRNHPGTWDVNDTWGVDGNQVFVDIIPDQANLAGVTNSDVARTLNAYYTGHYLTTFREGDHQVPVYFRLRPDQRGTISGLSYAFVEGLHGKVPLDSVAKIEQRFDAARIERRDLNRLIEVRAQVEPGFLGNDVVKSIMASEEMQQLQAELPTGYWISVGGMLEESTKSGKQMAVCLSISILVIWLLLIFQYNGWAKPSVIFATVPLSLIGAFPGLYFTGNPLGFMSQLGILSLFGVVLNAAILLIEFATILLADRIKKCDGSGPIMGLTKQEFRACLVDAGSQRLLPIFLSIAAAIGGLFPLALGGGPLWEGMAWAMIFGLAVATLLTLFVVPALYAIVVELFHVKPVRLEEPTDVPASGVTA